MNELQIFKNSEFGEIRTLIKDNEPWFVAKDVAQILGYSETAAMNKRLDEDEFISAKLEGMNMNSTLINESGLYNAVLGSNKPEAKEFKKWVTSEVLPSIRKTGTYIAPSVDSKMLYQIAQALEAKEQENQALLLETNAKTQIINELKPKADYTDAILKNKGLVTITQIAKDYGMSGQAMNDLLHELKIQYKQSDQWLLYREHQDKGFTHSETIPITRKSGLTDITMQTKWTQKGRLFIYGLLKERGILPVIEKTA